MIDLFGTPLSIFAICFFVPTGSLTRLRKQLKEGAVPSLFAWTKPADAKKRTKPAGARKTDKHREDGLNRSGVKTIDKDRQEGRNRRRAKKINKQDGLKAEPATSLDESTHDKVFKKKK
jgi:hypothetical protein